MVAKQSKSILSKNKRTFRRSQSVHRWANCSKNYFGAHQLLQNPSEAELSSVEQKKL